MSREAKGAAWEALKARMGAGPVFCGMDWGKPGDDKTSWWVVNPGTGPQGFHGTGPMLDFQRNAAGVYEMRQ